MAACRRNSVIAIMVLAGMVMADIDQHPKDAGSSMTRNAAGVMADGAYDNPALLGVERSPKGGLLVPPVTDVGFGYWSDKLYLKPYRAYFGVDADDPDVWQAILEEALRESFDLDGLSPDETSKKLADGLEGGVSFYTGSRLSLASFNIQRFGVDIETRMDGEIHLPEGVFYAGLADVGLLPGNTLDLSDLSADFLWTTSIRLALGLPVSIPALHRFFKLDYGAGGVAVKYVMGHSIFQTETESGTITYTENNSYDVDAQVTLETAGTGLHGAWDMFDGALFHEGFPVKGHGIGVDAGGILYDDRGSMSISITDLGVLFWISDTRKVTYTVKKDDLDVYDIISAIDSVKQRHEGEGDFNASDHGDEILLEIVNLGEGEDIPLSNDSLEETSSFVSMLPLALDIGYTRSWNFTRASSPAIKYLFEDITVGANYQQQLSNYPGRSFVPRLSIGTEFGTLRNWLPLRIGMILGGPEKFASTLGFGINARYFSIHAAYKAVGHVFFAPRRGMELALGMNVNWGMSTDSDKDGIPDREDKCPYEPEDKDKFEDEDGCPDEDNDKDGLKDTDDKCPNDPEDKDGFEDEDGCPDEDNDQDGIKDVDDKCPDDPEDTDNFEDEDGCPELDNDKDGVPDSTDKCPVLPEDIDNFEDEDGCPEYDNDKDGIPDSTDRCVSDPETYNGYQDQDGCPDELPKPTEKEQKVLYKKLSSVNFKTGSAELTPESFAHLNFVADFLKKYPHLRYEVQGHTDSRGGDEYNLLLSAARAASVRGYLIKRQVPPENLIAIGYGETDPIADNATAKGRAMNRRVQFKVIETKEEYEELKIKAAQFRARVEKAKIRGAGAYGW